MASKDKEIRRRIRSVRNTMQLTRAMKMVSAAKLRRAQERMMRARPYSERMLRVLQSLAARANPENHPLLQTHGDRRVRLVVISSDKGLCGSFNAHICKTAQVFADGAGDREMTLTPVGRKARDYFTRRGYALSDARVNVLRDLDFAVAAEIADELMQRYVDEELDEVHLAYNEFKSAIQQKPVVQRLLPIEPDEFLAGQVPEDYIYEPTAAELFKVLLPRHVEVQVYHALLETAAAEHAARMTAMDAATNNAGELIESLTLAMNRMRQASITTEIIEVVSGAEALG